MEIPTNLKHKPVLVVEDYDKVDGGNVLNMDVKGLSLGPAQRSDRRRIDISGKVRRHTGEKWSRQSKELPITHISDPTILAAQGSLYLQDAYRHEKLYDPENPVVDIAGLQGNRVTAKVDIKNPKTDEDIILYYDIPQKDGEFIGERFCILKRLLDELGYQQTEMIKRGREAWRISH